mmetsp:Transcript_920/g.1938  ORF Transcript_920/g.1938 Transcript_920/m.1938 type:complete len:259 (-) Transcript_920:28-804(-)
MHHNESELNTRLQSLTHSIALLSSCNGDCGKIKSILDNNRADVPSKRGGTCIVFVPMHAPEDVTSTTRTLEPMPNFIICNDNTELAKIPKGASSSDLSRTQKLPIFHANSQENPWNGFHSSSSSLSESLSSAPSPSPPMSAAPLPASVGDIANCSVDFVPESSHKTNSLPEFPRTTSRGQEELSHLHTFLIASLLTACVVMHTFAPFFWLCCGCIIAIGLALELKAERKYENLRHPHLRAHYCVAKLLQVQWRLRCRQ